MNAPSLLTLPVARASVPSNMSKAPPMKTTIPPTSQSWRREETAPTTVIPKPISVSPSGVRPSRPIPSAIGSKTFLMRPRDSFEIDIGLARHAEDRALAGRELRECLLAEAADGLAALAPRLDDASSPEATEMPRHERLREPDVGDELGDGRLALGQATDDAQAVHVGHDLVEGTQLAKFFGLGDGCGDRAADPGGRGGQGDDSGFWGGASWHINHDLYQSPLMLSGWSSRCQDHAAVDSRRPSAHRSG